MVVAAPLVYGRIVIDMATMINEDNLFKTLRRTFANALSEMLGEVLQNSQRAGATRVEIATSAGKEQSIVTIEDDGRGIADWRALLVVAQSDFDRAVMEDQAPMGVGFGSVLAYDGIASVGIASGGRSLHIETGRWWEDRAYREGWEGRLEAVDMPTGTRLTLTGATGLAGAVARAFIPDRYDTEKAVARGYQGILTVTVDGREAPVDVLPANALTEADTPYDKLVTDIVDDYEGNLVRIRIGNAKPRGYHSTGLVANWYGQLVKHGWPHGDVYLEVRQGRPINPKAPTRQGLIRDEALRRFEAWVTDRMFAHVAALPFEEVTPRHLHALHDVDPARFAREIPYVVVQRLNPIADSVHNSDEVDTRTSEIVPRARLAAMELAAFDVTLACPVCLSGSDAHARQARAKAEARRAEYAARDEAWRGPHDGVDEAAFMPCNHGASYSYGLSSFARALGLGIAAVATGHTPDRRLWWMPADPDPRFARHGDIATRPGRWGWGLGDEPPTEWRDLPEGRPVFVFDQTAHWDWNSEGDLVCYAPAGLRDFLETYGWASFEASDDADDDGDYGEKSFGRSIGVIIRALMGPDVVKAEWSLDDLQNLFPRRWDQAKGCAEYPEGLVKRIEVRYQPMPGNAPTTAVRRLLVKTTTGRSKCVLLYGD